MLHFYITFIYQCLRKITKLIREVRAYSAGNINKFVSVCSVSTDHVVCSSIKMGWELHKVRPSRCRVVSVWRKQIVIPFICNVYKFFSYNINKAKPDTHGSNISKSTLS